MTLDEILKEIKKSEKILILTHETPDGDAIGSSLGLKLALEKLGKNADLLMSKYAKTFNFLPKISEIKTESDIKEYDLAISLDCATFKRLDNREYIRKVIDNNNILEFQAMNVYYPTIKLTKDEKQKHE